MHLAVYLPLVIPVIAALAARPLAERLPPRLATWLLAGSALALAAASSVVLGLLALTAIVRVPLIAGLGHMSGRAISHADPASAPVAIIAAAFLAYAAVAACRALLRRATAIAAAGRRARDLPGAGQIVVTEDETADAYTLPGWPCRIVVTSGMLRALSEGERTVLLAHERTHATGSHYLFTAAARLAAAANPLLRPVAAAVGYTVERWADERAATAAGDRALAARAIARAALATSAAPPRRDRLSAALGLVTLPWAGRKARGTGPVPRRVAALLGPPPRPSLLLVAVALLLVAVSGVSTLEAARNMHQFVEYARSFRASLCRGSDNRLKLVLKPSGRRDRKTAATRRPGNGRRGERHMPIPSALEIARQAMLKPIAEIADDIGIPPWLIEPHGQNVAKIDLRAVEELQGRPKAKYVVVTAITPTPLGEGKTTTTIGLGQAFAHIGKKATIAIRQASMGPTFGLKGGAAGGGYSQAVPFEILNLHLTGDMHAVTAAHNQLSAMVDNHLYMGNELGLDLSQITWKHVIDVNDRSLRNIVTGLGAAGDGVPRQSGFDITAASEAMAILALSRDLRDMRARLGRIVVGYTKQGDPVTAEELKAAGAMAVIMKDALKPNLLQTLENTPVFVHAGPFGNIAHGNSSVVADLIAIHAGDFLVTEAGFGADMGAERFFNIKCRTSGLTPDAAVVVASVRALKSHTGRYKVVAGRPLPEDMLRENPDDVIEGSSNLRKQLENIRAHGVEPVVAINAMPGDFPSEYRAIHELAAAMGIKSAVGTHFADGGRGATEIAEAVAEVASSGKTSFRFLYPSQATLKEKIEAVATRLYGADGVDYTPLADRQLASYEKNGFGSLPVCIAKTQYSLSHDASLKGAPTGWRLPVREVRASVGAGFVYPICGDMRTMPGLARNPAAMSIDLDDEGNIVGLY